MLVEMETVALTGSEPKPAEPKEERSKWRVLGSMAMGLERARNLAGDR